MRFVKTVNINFADNLPTFPITKSSWSYLKLLLICLLELGFGFDQSLPRGKPVGKSPYYRSFDPSANWRVKDSMELRANAASQSDSPATGAATFPAQHTTIGIGIRSSCCSFLATQTMVCSKMKDEIWQKTRDKKHFFRDEIYWWQRERTLMGHAHILWVLLSTARIAVRALNCITYHVAEPVGVWNGLCAPASKPSNRPIARYYSHLVAARGRGSR